MDLDDLSITNFIVNKAFGGKDSTNKKKIKIKEGGTQDILTPPVGHNFENLQDIGLSKETECAFPSNEEESGVCVNHPKVIEIYKKFAGVSDLEKALEKSKEKTNCDSELCVLKHHNYQNLLKEEMKIDNYIVRKEIHKIITENFKPNGPLDDSWTSNIEIDQTLRLWAKEFDDFYPVQVTMSDLYDYNSPLTRHSILDIIDGKIPTPVGSRYTLIKRPIKRIGCVLNTDKHTRNGQHWNSLFIDITDSNNITIDYFDSAGKPPVELPAVSGNRPVLTFMEDTKKKLKQRYPNSNIKININNIQYQKSATECGLYALFFIRSRLMGKNMKDFKDIPDYDMYEFRKMIFRE